MKYLLAKHADDIIKMDCWDIQVFLGRKMYEMAVEEGNFMPSNAD